MAKNADVAIKRVVLLTLKSPRFLYRELPSERDGFAVASRLSFELWDSMPDEELLKAARPASCRTAEVVRQAERMLGDPRAKVKLREFLHTWLKIDQPRDVAKDPKRFPGFDQDIVWTFARRSICFSTTWSGRSDRTCDDSCSMIRSI